MNRRKFLITAGATAAIGASLTASAEDVDANAMGALGDGVTDDSDALQRSIEAAAETGGAVLLSAGTYRLSRTLFLDVVDSDVAIVGAGAEATVLRIEGEEGDPALWIGPDPASAPAYVAIAGLRVESTGTTTESTLVGEIGIVVGAVGGIAFEDMVFADLDGNQHSTVSGVAEVSFS